MKRYDFVVIGGGSAGYAAARTAAEHGLATAVIEGGEEVGGLCILRGCMPSKALLYAAEVRHLAKKASVWGIHSRTGRVNLQEVMRRKDEVIEEFAGYRRYQLDNGPFDFIRAKARFVDDRRVELDSGVVVEAKHFLIGTGSRVAPSPLPQLTDAGYWTSDDLLRIQELPSSVLVLGGGPIALELAQFLARLDVDVSLVQRSARLIKEFDPDASEAVRMALRDDGVKVFTETQLTDAGKDQEGKWVAFEHKGQKQTLHGEEILFALGRTPNTSHLQLDKAGVTVNKQGRVLVDDRQRSVSASHIFAAGDCCGPYEIVHLAVQQGEIAAFNAAHPDRRKSMDYRLLTSIVFTDPQVASVGLTEHAAREQGIPFLASSYPFNDHGKSIIMDIEHGFVKLLAHEKTGEIIGGECAGPVGGELIHEVIVAMAGRMTAAQFAAVPHYHPTLAEIWTYPAEDLAERIRA